MGTVATITAAGLAACLNGRQYLKEITDEEHKLARAAGLVVAFSGSDDLLYLAGMANDELGAGNDTTIYLTDYGETSRLKTPISVRAQWCPRDLKTSWLITASVPFSPFDIMEDDDLYCRGCVFSLKPERME